MVPIDSPIFVGIAVTCHIKRTVFIIHLNTNDVELFGADVDVSISFICNNREQKKKKTTKTCTSVVGGVGGRRCIMESGVCDSTKGVAWIKFVIKSSKWSVFVVGSETLLLF